MAHAGVNKIYANDRLLLYLRLARLTPHFCACFIRDCLYAMSCVILLLMTDASPFGWLLRDGSKAAITALEAFCFEMPGSKNSLSDLGIDDKNDSLTAKKARGPEGKLEGFAVFMRDDVDTDT